jgi:ParB family transcriptional regulator, chromosome partitioning protein
VIKRKDALRQMLAPITEQNLTEQRPAKASSKSGSLKAMGLSLQSLSDEADEARQLRAQLATGDRVVELDPELIEPSIIRDRLPDTSSDDLDELRASIAERGQQVPILVRPNPEREGYYQVAYGHRRVEVLRSLAKPVKAVVRVLSDEELVVAQGKENLERRDLSFIERCVFATRLEDRGFERSALMASLAVHKGNLSTMIAVARAVPEELIMAIGRAPKIGRPRWEQLAELLRARSVDWRSTIGSQRFAALDSNGRFDCVLRAAMPKRTPSNKLIVKDPGGRPIAGVEQANGRMKLTIDEQSTSSFGAYLIDKLPELYVAFRSRADGDPRTPSTTRRL